MFKFTRTGIAYVIALTIFIIFQIFINQYKIKPQQNENIMENMQEINLNTENKIEEAKAEIPEQIKESKSQEDNKEKEIWKIEIPKISLKAEISEGTTKETLNRYVGHFEKTKKEEGNVGLAGHNRGYEVNYFQNLKQLQEGDEIKYTHNKFEKIYEVEKCRIIKDTDWEYLEDTEENRLTLITCVENQPEYRRCIQAIEKEEEIY